MQTAGVNCFFSIPASFDLTIRLADDDPEPKAGPDPCQRLLDILGRLDDIGVKGVRWRDFESQCARILEENGYRVLGSIWFKGQGRRYQIDLVGALMGRLICVDCKAWTRGGGSSRSRRAAESQKERTIQLKGCMSVRGLEGHGGMRFYPLVVTLRAEDITIHEGVPVVPFEKLNSFIVGFDCYEDELFRV